MGDSHARTGRRRWGRWLLRGAMLAGVVAATIWTFRGPIQREPFMGDESGWIASGNYYLNLIVNGNFHTGDWVANHLGTEGNFNPHLGKVLMALGIRWHPNRAPGDTEYVQVYDWSRPPEWNREHGHIPPDGLLIRGRESAGIFVSACMAALLIIGTLIAGEIAGGAAVLFALTSDTIQRILALAVTDSYYNFFILTGLLGSAGLVKFRQPRWFVFFSILMGLSAGLACSVKITGLPVVAFYYSLLLIPIWRERGLSLPTAVYGPLAAITAAVVTVYVLNPFFWPFESPRMMLEFPRLYVRTRSAFESVPNGTWGTPPDRLGGIHAYLFHSTYWGVPGEALAFAAGLLVCGSSFVRGLIRRQFSVFGALFVYFAAHYLFIVSLVQFNWARYYLPTVFSMKLIAGVGVAVPLLWIAKALRARGSAEKMGTGPEASAATTASL